MNIKKVEFPKEIANRLNNRIRQSIKIEYYGGAFVELDKFNLSVLQPHKVLFRKDKRFIIVYIIENEIAKNGRYNYFLNSISKESKHTLNNIINLINANMCP